MQAGEDERIIMSGLIMPNEYMCNKYMQPNEYMCSVYDEISLQCTMYYVLCTM